MQDNWLRSIAEFDNFQKMTSREKQNAKDYAIQSFARELINNMDILHLAMNSVPAEHRSHIEAGSETSSSASSPSSAASLSDQGKHLADLFIGVAMTAKELEKTLGRFGVSAFDPTGQKFDPNLHEAMYQAPVPGKETGSVLECQKKGWMLKDRLLRPAQVGVVMESG